MRLMVMAWLASVGAGALDPDRCDRPMAGQEVQGPAVTIGGGRELLVGEVAAPGVDHGHVDGVEVGIDAADHRAWFERGHCHDGNAFRVDSVGRRRSGEQTGH